jgi:hypothetical protein
MSKLASWRYEPATSMPMKHPATLDPLKVLVVDDNEAWVETLVDLFENASIKADGISDPSTLFSWTAPEKFANFDMIFLDMRLGSSKTGAAISAADVLLHIMTYSPTAKAVVFTQEVITVEECVRCIQLGALGFVPKMLDIHHFVLVANVYRNLGDDAAALEERIRSLWLTLEKDVEATKGRYLEMLITNLFHSIPGFRVVSNNSLVLTGEIDLVIENLCPHEFWKTIDSYHIVVECKNRKSVSEKEVFNVLTQKVVSKALCNIGILVSWTGVSSGIREMQRAQSGNVKIFTLDRDDLHELVRRIPENRESYLRGVFERQL